MAIGTAGYTAMLCVLALEAQGVTPAKGPVLVTGAAGGVGSVAIALLAKLGYSVIASTGRAQRKNRICVRSVLPKSSRGRNCPAPASRSGASAGPAPSIRRAATRSPMRWRRPNMAARSRLAASRKAWTCPRAVAPFILRGVTLAGIDSVMAPKPKRLEAWARLAQDLDRGKLAAMTQTHSWKDVLELAPQILAGKVRGRIVLEVN